MTRWLDDVEMSAWRGLVEFNQALAPLLDADLLKDFGINAGDYAVLVNLSEAPDHCLRMSDLAAVLRLSPSGLTRRLDGIVQRGLVTRVPAEDDRRSTFAVLSEAGFDLLKTAAPIHVEGVRRYFIDHLDRDQLAGLGVAMRTALAGLESVERMAGEQAH